MPFSTPPGMEIGPPSMRRATSVQAPLSNELEALLQEAEQRIGGQMGHESMLPSPEEEIEAVLPAEVLASLDEPIDDEDDDDDLGVEPLGAISRANTTGAGKVTTGGGSASTGGGSTGPGSSAALGSAPPFSAGVTGTGRAAGAGVSVTGEEGTAAPVKTHGGTHGGTHAGSHAGIPTTGARGFNTSDVQRREDTPTSQPRLPVDRADARAPGERYDARGSNDRYEGRAAQDRNEARGSVERYEVRAAQERYEGRVSPERHDGRAAQERHEVRVAQERYEGRPAQERYQGRVSPERHDGRAAQERYEGRVSPERHDGRASAERDGSSERNDAGGDRIEQRSSVPPPTRATHPPPTMGAVIQAPRPRAANVGNIPNVLGPGDAPRALAEAIASRATGVLTFESTSGLRRAVFREGDLVTAASGVDAESLLAFLAARGELPRDRVEQLSGKLPPFGRHAGAALVAHGYLRQDQLWAVLRAHAEWVLGRIVALDSGSAILEPDAQGRLRNEPSVFGGSTGAEVFVEVARRVIAPQEAIARLGGDTSHLADGANGALLSECALNAAELDWITRARGRSIGDALASAHEADIASVVYALALLGVVEAIRAVGAPRAVSNGAAPSSQAIDALDEEAIRARVRARLQLVDEGDYFAVLGVSRDATSYEVKRAFLELRRAFEPSRILTAPLADLQNDVRKIAMVLDEAYEILRDAARRERYRRAIEATPRA
jgi:hypothetical protein